MLGDRLGTAVTASEIARMRGLPDDHKWPLVEIVCGLADDFVHGFSRLLQVIRENQQTRCHSRKQFLQK
jgi:hypothetical protein